MSKIDKGTDTLNQILKDFSYDRGREFKEREPKRKGDKETQKRRGGTSIGQKEDKGAGEEGSDVKGTVAEGGGVLFSTVEDEEADNTRIFALKLAL
ncbi:MAG: hypothetical protein II539_01470, partial [Muribaculaceae bacterium]|nr:hypothetical protein [Muribaculaceae bacterium]